jgi:hypothetical protein
MQWLNDAKDGLQALSYFAGVIIAGFAVRSYRNSVKTERAKWLEKLYARFYEDNLELKKVRDILDSDEADSEQVKALVREESANFTDYLNFFEFVAYLKDQKHLSQSDIEAIFQYYIDCLSKHPSVRAYINKHYKGFEYLRKLLSPP